MGSTGSYDDRELLYPDTVSGNRRDNADQIAISAFAAEQFQALYKKGETWDAIGAKFGFSKATTINVALHGKAIGYSVSQKIANVLFRGSYDALKQAATEWWSSELGRTWRSENPHRDPADNDTTYPNRAVAIQCGRLLGFDERAFDKIRGLRVKSTIDPPARWWFKQLESIEAEVTDPWRDEPAKALAGDPVETARKQPRSRK